MALSAPKRHERRSFNGRSRALNQAQTFQRNRGACQRPRFFRSLLALERPDTTLTELKLALAAFERLPSEPDEAAAELRRFVWR